MIQINAGIHGNKELDEALKQLPKALQKQVVMAALKKVAEPVRDAAKTNVSVDDGDLRDSIEIGTKLSRRQARIQGKKDYPQVFVGPTHPSGAHGHLVEFGTSSHVIIPKKKGGKKLLRFEIAGETIFVERVEHPGTQPKPFLRPAWDLNAFRIPGELGKILWTVLLKKSKALARKAERGTLGTRTRAQLRGSK